MNRTARRITATAATAALVASLMAALAASPASAGTGAALVQADPGGPYVVARDATFDGSGSRINRYVVNQDALTWSQARGAAASYPLSSCKSTHLATVTSQREQNAIHDGLGNAIAFKWLGASKNGGWQWVTDEPWDYTNWQPGEPSGDGKALHVGGGGVPTPSGWKYDGKWNDAPMSGAARSLVEREDCSGGRFDWDFGDGQVALNAGPRPTHQFANAGTYDVCLKLTDAKTGTAHRSCVTATVFSKAACRDAGWKDLGFRNQGQCVRYVNTGKDSRD